MYNNSILLEELETVLIVCVAIFLSSNQSKISKITNDYMFTLLISMPHLHSPACLLDYAAET